MSKQRGKRSLVVPLFSVLVGLASAIISLWAAFEASGSNDLAKQALAYAKKSSTAAVHVELLAEYERPREKDPNDNEFDHDWVYNPYLELANVGTAVLPGLRIYTNEGSDNILCRSPVSGDSLVPEIRLPTLGVGAVAKVWFSPAAVHRSAGGKSLDDDGTSVEVTVSWLDPNDPGRRLRQTVELYLVQWLSSDAFESERPNRSINLQDLIRQATYNRSLYAIELQSSYRSGGFEFTSE